MADQAVDPRPLLLSSIEISGSRVEFSDSPIVLLCGGPVLLKDRVEDDDPPLASLRDAITRSIPPYEIFRPEEIQGWHNDAIYKNLMDFEADLASICSLVVVVLESAGALVELGAFSQFPELSKKLIAVKSSSYSDDPSFINLGVLRYMMDNHPSCVKNYPWSVNRPQEISRDVVDDVISDVADELSKLGKGQRLKPSLATHIIVLICEIVRLMTALKEGEILEYLAIFGVDLPKEKLRSKLFLLEEFRLLVRVVYSDSTFYLRGSESYHRLSFAFKSDSRLDAFRVEMDVKAYYSADPKSRHRLRAIAQATERARK
ncbi:retron St85 family effector protein [Burkholderia stabilis]|uniref:retron St85 family effector protein n=1 Tax=Burkholderia stabilis TaxID=95485 RepID=UPI0012EA3B47|nr:retron St85 family effector protein [Burkholderia stabilis]HDR9496156.1 retron St85 family effector protein [Burkholderia stabilis]HDR9527645.1 retron St85 family effector protein [Burkholderia stabilis]HDR9534527.1 retron St85 family effector protein [Burkholderia stabilis]HDR9542728.1 retron St85 family effector protein [Burkholderia stabilis]HDR9547486.1 retron St85 family effector protein [Burkholderia stabilis]